jgi:hypothetical protein
MKTELQGNAVGSVWDILESETLGDFPVGLLERCLKLCLSNQYYLGRRLMTPNKQLKTGKKRIY